MIAPDIRFVDIWTIDLNDPDLDRLEILAKDERLRANKFAFDSGRNNYVRSRCTLRRILGACLKRPAEQIAFRYNEHDKPELSMPDAGDVHFNLSHSNETALICVSGGRRSGIDVNHLGRTKGFMAIAKRTFSEAEQASFFALPLEAQEETFYRIWSQKEAYTKAFGDGFSYGFQHFSVVVDAGGGAGLLADDKSPNAVNEWHIVPIDVGPGRVAALAYDGVGTPEIRQWEFVS